jgi:hypothetical protein
MATAEGWDDLPAHFQRERSVLLEAGVTRWERLAMMSGERLRALARSGGASEARLRRLRAQARLMTATGLTSAEASLLLHAGIVEAGALAVANPQQLLVQVNRLARQLIGPTARPISLATVRGWIQAAASRSAK